MASNFSVSRSVKIALAILFVFLSSKSLAQLSTGFYHESCKDLDFIVKTVVEKVIENEARMGASLLRLHFHDCFVQGCDASVLLQEELVAAPNQNSLRGMDVIDKIKAAIESVCPETVSCADILAIVARDSVVKLGGHYWDVKLGRRDGKSASTQAANIGIPSLFSNLSVLIQDFNKVNLSVKDLVVLSGAHTIGQAKCTSFKNRIYNETGSIDAVFAQKRQSDCKKTVGPWDNSTAPLDLMSPRKFDNKYYKNIVDLKSLLPSDQILFNDSRTTSSKMVNNYANNENAFLKDFAISMVKMGDISPLTGNQGEIRKICSKPN